MPTYEVNGLNNSMQPISYRTSDGKYWDVKNASTLVNSSNGRQVKYGNFIRMYSKKGNNSNILKMRASTRNNNKMRAPTGNQNNKNKSRATRKNRKNRRTTRKYNA
jgi:hypothetical protein